MPLTPGYGETPLPGDEFIALLPHVTETAVVDKRAQAADAHAGHGHAH